METRFAGHPISTGWHLPVRCNENHRDPLLVPPSLADNSMAAVFNRAGYVTFRTCKRGNSYEDASAIFTHRHDATRRGGRAESGSAWHGDHAIEFLKTRQQQAEVEKLEEKEQQSENEERDDRPFLMYLGFSHPHDTRDGTPENDRRAMLHERLFAMACDQGSIFHR